MLPLTATISIRVITINFPAFSPLSCPTCSNMSGCALECYLCSSQVSWENCAKNLTKGTCAPNLDNCAKLYARSNGEVFARGCGTSYKCSNQETCNGLVLIKCTLHCCRGDLCKRAFRLELGAVILVSSLLTSLNAMYFILTNEQ